MSTNGFIKTAAVSPKVKTADIGANTDNIIQALKSCLEQGCSVIVMPELCITSYTCMDYFLNSEIINRAEQAVKRICDESAKLYSTIGSDFLLFVGCPVEYCGRLYNCAVAINNGAIAGIVPKTYIPNYNEFYEHRWFKSGDGIKSGFVGFAGQSEIPFGTGIIFAGGGISIGAELCEDLWAVVPPSCNLALNGAEIICNLSASNELITKNDYRLELVKSQSARCIGAYIYACANAGESTSGVVFAGDSIIAENGSVLARTQGITSNGTITCAIIDIDRLKAERIRNSTYRDSKPLFECKTVPIKLDYGRTQFTFDRYIKKNPFVSENPQSYQLILDIQAQGLAGRLNACGAKKMVLGVSGGLDSTLALLVCAQALKRTEKAASIIAVTMPGFGTTGRTYGNAVKLCRALGCELREIDIKPACLQHFKDIGHDAATLDITYENVQARERTQILMDIANKEGGIVVGTGDLSEIALGWSTYAGDQISMYNVNAGVPKTLIRYLISHIISAKTMSHEICAILQDILETPVSPELLPAENDSITQKTEDIVGPYELHDFFLYYFVRFGFSKAKILFLAQNAFGGDYSRETIEKWLDVFAKRFVTQHFKRVAAPDSPKVGSVSLASEFDARFPSDASTRWLNMP